MFRLPRKKRLFLAGMTALALSCNPEGGAQPGNGAVIYRAQASPCGETLFEENSLAGDVSYAFTGYEIEKTFAALDANARIYLPAFCRFTSLDPVPQSEEHGLTPYNYAGGNPIKNVDPDGRQYKITFWLAKQFSNWWTTRQRLKMQIEQERSTERPTRTSRAKISMPNQLRQKAQPMLSAFLRLFPEITAPTKESLTPQEIEFIETHPEYAKGILASVEPYPDQTVVIGPWWKNTELDSIYKTYHYLDPHVLSGLHLMTLRLGGGNDLQTSGGRIHLSADITRDLNTGEDIVVGTVHLDRFGPQLKCPCSAYPLIMHFFADVIGRPLRRFINDQPTLVYPSEVEQQQSK